MRPVFLKLGGSLITDKQGVEAVRLDVLARLAAEIAGARAQVPDLALVLGHGSGSFGHVYAARYGTRAGVAGPDQWAGFAAVADAAVRLNAAVRAALLAAGVPAVTLSPVASAACADGALRSLALNPIRQALAAGLVPLVHGDVAFDSVRGGTIVSTEEVLAYLAADLTPRALLLAGVTDGVYDGAGQIMPRLSSTTLTDVRRALGGSAGTDVTGGMATKVEAMIDLARRMPDTSIRIFSGQTPGAVQQMIVAGAEGATVDFGTEIGP